MKIIPSEISTVQLQSYLQGAIAPRPICFASTVDEHGNVNLSPFSFFNLFGTKPPILIFSPSRRVRNNTNKHTLHNAVATKEVVINMVNFSMVQQMSLSSCEYPDGVNEFVKAGLTEVKSEFVKPPRIAESPVSFECKVNEIIHTGDEGGSGNLIICEILCMHINDEILNDKGIIDPNKIDLVARMGGDTYCRASGEALFVVPKPNVHLGIGFDQLPDSVKNSKILSGNDLGMLANVHEVPEHNEAFTQVHNIFSEEQSHQVAKDYLQMGDVNNAWQALLAFSTKQ